MRLQGTFIDTPSLGELIVYKDYILDVNDQGIILFFDSASASSAKDLLEHDLEPIVLVPAGSFVLPTFCDLHLHAPQFLYQGNGLDLPLLEWLDQYTYKAEERMDADPILAQRVYTRLAERLVENGTGAVSLFGTIKEDTNLILATSMQAAGVRARVGKLSMDVSSRPTYVESSTEKSLEAAQTFVDRCLLATKPQSASEARLIEPVLTPRFVPTCSNELLAGLGSLSSNRSLPIQSHLAEAQDQVEWVRSTRGKEDIDVFDGFNLLTPRTLQAHCTFLTPPDLNRVAAAGTSIAHCPLSNIYFSTEPFPLREALTKNVKVGLGTDVAGGYSLDIMNAMRSAVAVSRMRDNQRRVKHGGQGDSLAVTWQESLYLATRGGSIALGISQKSGVFEVGAPFDAQQIQLVDSSGTGVGHLDFFEYDTEKPSVTLNMIEKWWCIGDNRNRKAVWVQGKRIL
ncbi:Metallo-dependent hydrolase, partial [Coprinopsis marcescibilis]